MDVYMHVYMHVNDGCVFVYVQNLTTDQHGIPSEIDVYSFTPPDSDDDKKEYPHSYEIRFHSSPKTEQFSTYQNINPNAKQWSAYENINPPKKTLKRRTKMEDSFESEVHLRQQDHKMPEGQEPMYETVESLPISDQRVTKQYFDTTRTYTLPRANKTSELLQAPQGELKMDDDSSITESDTHSQVF